MLLETQVFKISHKAFAFCGIVNFVTIREGVLVCIFYEADSMTFTVFDSEDIEEWMVVDDHFMIPVDVPRLVINEIELFWIRKEKLDIEPFIKDRILRVHSKDRGTRWNG